MIMQSQRKMFMKMHSWWLIKVYNDDTTINKVHNVENDDDDE